jgi:GNAT superfamily N-acetyltransferase
MEQKAEKGLPTGEIVYQGHSLTIIVKKEVDPDGISLLGRTIYGTHGVRYQHTGQEQKVKQLKNAFFFHLLHDGELIGLYCLDERDVELATRTVKAFYGRYLTIGDAYKGKGYGYLLKKAAVGYVEEKFSPPFLFYSYIEEKNVKSLKISQNEGFTSVAVLETFLFRRYAPQLDPRFNRLPTVEMGNQLGLLKEYYKDYSFSAFAHIGHQDNYFVLKEGADVIAGVQANPTRWHFLHMPGVQGWAMMHLFPLLAPTRRFFNPTNYNFIALEGLYLKKGREDELTVLLEGALAYFRCHTALFQIDTRDTAYALLTSKHMGVLSGFQKDIRTHVMVKTVGLSADEAKAIGQHPLYVSSFDFT